MLLGVGYIIGPRIAAVMVGGGMLTALMLTPMIAYFGDGLPAVLPPGQQKISEMSPGQISSQYVRYIGAGAVAMGGILSMLNALPLIVALDPRQPGRNRRGRQQDQLDGTDGEEDRPPPGPIATSPCPSSCWAALGLVAAIAASDLIPTDRSAGSSAA